MAETEIKPFHCTECGDPLIDCPSGSVCPNGHGRVQPKLPADIRRRHAALVALKLPDAVPYRGNYRVPCHDGEWKKVRTINRVLTSRPDDLAEGQLLALFGCKILVLERVNV